MLQLQVLNPMVVELSHCHRACPHDGRTVFFTVTVANRVRMCTSVVLCSECLASAAHCHCVLCSSESVHYITLTPCVHTGKSQNVGALSVNVVMVVMVHVLMQMVVLVTLSRRGWWAGQLLTFNPAGYLAHGTLALQVSLSVPVVVMPATAGWLFFVRL